MRGACHHRRNDDHVIPIVAASAAAAGDAVSSTSSPSIGPLRVDGAHLVDSKGRIALPRGIAFSGLSKVPKKPDGATHIGGANFYKHREVSFRGRPCELEDLDLHLETIRTWGFTLLRLLVTWEAVEHKGPGQYDEDYLEYLQAVCRRAHDFGLLVLIDPHQDCWCRWTGGDGAPGWTLEASNMKVGPCLHQTKAAFLHQENGDPLPTMSWPKNYDRLACATMFSLFWAGDRLAPGMKPFGAEAAAVGAKSLQDLLQTSFINSMARVAAAVRDIPSVIGFETLNEPHPGWIGMGNIEKAMLSPVGSRRSPFQQMKSAAIGKDGIWQNDQCLWAQAGVWNQQTGEILDASRFRCGDWMSECFGPFVRRYARAIQDVMPNAIIGVCPPAFGAENREPFAGNLPKSAVWAPHFYDGLLLVNKNWDPNFGIEETDPRTKLLGGVVPVPSIQPVLGLEARVQAYKRQVSWKSAMQGIEARPTIIGEIGIPFDASGGSETARAEAMNAHWRALEELMVPICWWNYTPENTSRRGDGWNGEDLSVYCKEDGGGRTVPLLARPHLLLCAGTPVSQTFEPKEVIFRCEFDTVAEGETVFIVPLHHFQSISDTLVRCRSGDEVLWQDSPNGDRSLIYKASRPGRAFLQLSKKKAPMGPSNL